MNGRTTYMRHGSMKRPMSGRRAKLMIFDDLAKRPTKRRPINTSPGVLSNKTLDELAMEYAFALNAPGNELSKMRIVNRISKEMFHRFPSNDAYEAINRNQELYRVLTMIDPG